MEEITLGNITFSTYDLGGHEQARRVWKDYYTSVDAIVFLVDSCDQPRFVESRHELDVRDNLTFAEPSPGRGFEDRSRCCSGKQNRQARGLLRRYTPLFFRSSGICHC